MDTNDGIEEDQFFDIREELDSDCSEDCSSSGLVNYASNALEYEFWNKNPESVQVRRNRLLKWMGLNLDWHPSDRDESGVTCYDNFTVDVNRVAENSKAVLANSDADEHYLSAQSSLSRSSNEAPRLAEDDDLEYNLKCRFRSLDDQIEFVVNESAQDQTLRRVRELGSNQTDTEAGTAKLMEKKKKVKRGWLQKLSALVHIVDKHQEANSKTNHMNAKVEPANNRVHVHSHKKQSKELSSLYAGQAFPAHEGSILTMKFSPDGQYLASSGKDGVVRVWKVTEEERPDTFANQDADPSCLYFCLDQYSKLVPLNVDKGTTDKVKMLRKSSESACVVFPPKVFQILEKPVHEFHGHSGEVLALSWSKKGCLLSSSVDKTVRLWQVGHDDCLGAFSHNNYVTCVEFNPVNDKYFISGSIDGKVRIWEVCGCRVVDWTDIREIVTALSYCPNGKGAIVGSLDGSCHFYDIIDDRLQLGSQMCLQGKKKLPGKMVTGFQFSPSDTSKVIVTSADSQIRILCGVNIICKMKGTRNSGNHISASFTSDGKHIVSVADDSNVCIWNYISQERTSARAKTILSCERFLSDNASFAIPWFGMKTLSGTSSSPENAGDDLPSVTEMGPFDKDLRHLMPSSTPDCFSVSRGFLLEPLQKGSATWPEEKLPYSRKQVVSPSMGKSEYKFLRSACQSTISSLHMWGLVIVTAGWDGRIRTYLNYGLPIRL